MKGRRFFWNTLITSLIVMTLMAVISFIFLTDAINQILQKHALRFLSSQSTGMMELFRDDIINGNFENIQMIAGKLSESCRLRITYMDSMGKVLVETSKDPSLLDNHADRSEVIQALRDTTGFSRRYSFTTRKNMLYFARAVISNNKIIGILRLSIPETEIKEFMTPIYFLFYIGIVFTFVMITLLTYFYYRKIIPPLKAIKEQLTGFNTIPPDKKLYAGEIREVKELADSVSTTIYNVQERIRELTSQISETESIFSGMDEGVIVIEANGIISRVNRSSLEIFKKKEEDFLNHTIEEAIRIPAIHRLVQTVFSKKLVTEKEISFTYNAHNIHLRVHGSPIMTEANVFRGVLLVITDITTTKKLENVRRDFFTNLTHELKTPITSIHGAVETLKDALKEDPLTIQRFVEIIERQTKRLEELLDDIFILSRIEQENEFRGFAFDQFRFKPLIEQVIKNIRDIADKRNMKIEISCPEDLKLHGKADLIEIALNNLVMNSLIYSVPGKIVKIRGYREGSYTCVAVEDEGIGIPQEHIPRIFERFYRVDKSRSRDSGGTGLGLAIVKHVAEAHNAEIIVESQIGKGSTFTLCIPDKTNV